MRRAKRTPSVPARLRRWFADPGWTPFPFQEEAGRAYARGDSGLIHTTPESLSLLLAQSAACETFETLRSVSRCLSCITHGSRSSDDTFTV